MNASTSTSNLPRPPSSAFSSLLAQANSLNRAEGDVELPQIRLGIDEIERMSESLGGRGKGRAGRNGEGHNLLSSLGVNTSRLSHSLAQFSTPGAPIQPSARPKRRRRLVAQAQAGSPEAGVSAYASSGGDLATWARKSHETIILSGIELQRQKIVKNFQDQFQERVLRNWEEEKAKILQDELGVTDTEIARLAGSSGGLLGQSGLGGSSLGSSARRFPMAPSSSTSGSDSRDGGLVMHTKMLRYERVVSDLNQRRVSRQPVELCQALENAVKGDPKSPQVPIAFHILAHMTHEPSLRDGSNGQLPEPVLERQYAQAYLGDESSTSAKHLRERLISGAKRYLETDFESHIDETIARNPKESARGGVPGIRNKVTAYTNVVLRSKESQEAFKPETTNGIFLWAQIYYLLRSGYQKEALAHLSESQHHLKREDYSLPGALKSFLSAPDRRLPKAQRDQLANDFNASIRSNPNVDQFKYAIYKLIGRFEISRKSLKVASTTEDWTWVQLSLIREGGNDAPQEAYDLADLGKLVLKYGADKFDEGGKRPFAWFNLLLLCGLFENAVGYLWSKLQWRIDAVHFGIALTYYGLLRTPPKADDHGILETKETPSGLITYLSFHRLIRTYIAPFFKLEPQAALQYAYLVALGADTPGETGETQKGFALELVRDIVLSSRAWSKLLGSVRQDGIKEAGLIERDLKLLRLDNEQEYVKAVILSAADQSTLDASLLDSIELFHLAGAYDRVIEAINRALGHALGQPNSPLDGGQKLGLNGAFGGAADVYDLAKRVHAVYERDPTRQSQIRREGWDTLEVLLKLKQALLEFGHDRPDTALMIFKSTNILPLDSDPSLIPRYAQRFTALLDQPVISNLDEVIVTTMKCLHRLSQALKNSPYGDQGRMDELNNLKYQAQALIQFASGLRLRLGGDVYRQLSSMSE